ncbi:MAG: hypothetical protein Q9170_007538 [Blastenia crenularia]
MVVLTTACLWATGWFSSTSDIDVCSEMATKLQSWGAVPLPKRIDLTVYNRVLDKLSDPGFASRFLMRKLQTDVSSSIERLNHQLTAPLGPALKQHELAGDSITLLKKINSVREETRLVTRNVELLQKEYSAVANACQKLIATSTEKLEAIRADFLLKLALIPPAISSYFVQKDLDRWAQGGAELEEEQAGSAAFEEALSLLAETADSVNKIHFQLDALVNACDSRGTNSPGLMRGLWEGIFGRV